MYSSSAASNFIAALRPGVMRPDATRPLDKSGLACRFRVHGREEAEPLEANAAFAVNAVLF